MAEDKREAILARLVEIAATIVPEKNAFRNKTEISEEKIPAIVVLDTDEVKSDRFVVDGKQRPSNAPVIVDLNPEIFLVLQDKAADLGTTLNSYRAKIIKAVMTDATLIGLCKEIAYDGFSTALNTGRSMQGQARVHFTFRYVLRIDQL